MDSILKISILVVITFSSWVETLNNEAIHTIDLSVVIVYMCVADKLRLRGLYCPRMTYQKKYNVIMIHNGEQSSGCASVEHNWYLSDSPLFHLWKNPIFEPIYCDNTCNRDAFIYECMSKSQPTNKKEIDNGLKYMSLYEYPPISNTSTPAYRCAVFITEKYEDHGIMAIRMAISSGRANSFDVKQCRGLSNVLTNKGDIYDHETQKKWPKEATYVFIMGDLEAGKDT
ncbi:Uncharacterized protein FWK35_00020030 [Aphis craccivora]|uniref:Uncharacterized protein n=1 Tax=Aphis craccivora TaxID=307492 RepID=A0A6G0YIR0_APHCR|nr:Uncharacterized protein FWK35_00020030 [Aphis craccivora]